MEFLEPELKNLELTIKIIQTLRIRITLCVTFSLLDWTLFLPFF